MAAKSNSSAVWDGPLGAEGITDPELRILYLIAEAESGGPVTDLGLSAARDIVRRSTLVQREIGQAGYADVRSFVMSQAQEGLAVERVAWTARFEFHLIRRLHDTGLLDVTQPFDSFDIGEGFARLRALTALRAEAQA